MNRRRLAALSEHMESRLVLSPLLGLAGRSPVALADSADPVAADTDNADLTTANSSRPGALRGRTTTVAVTEPTDRTAVPTADSGITAGRNPNDSNADTPANGLRETQPTQPSDEVTAETAETATSEFGRGTTAETQTQPADLRTVAEDAEPDRFAQDSAQHVVPRDNKPVVTIADGVTPVDTAPVAGDADIERPVAELSDRRTATTERDSDALDPVTEIVPVFDQQTGTVRLGAPESVRSPEEQTKLTTSDANTVAVADTPRREADDIAVISPVVTVETRTVDSRRTSNEVTETAEETNHDDTPDTEWVGANVDRRAATNSELPDRTLLTEEAPETSVRQLSVGDTVLRGNSSDGDAAARSERHLPGDVETDGMASSTAADETATAHEVQTVIRPDIDTVRGVRADTEVPREVDAPRQELSSEIDLKAATDSSVAIPALPTGVTSGQATAPTTDRTRDAVVVTVEDEGTIAATDGDLERLDSDEMVSQPEAVEEAESPDIKEDGTAENAAPSSSDSDDVQELTSSRAAAVVVNDQPTTAHGRDNADPPYLLFDDYAPTAEPAERKQWTDVCYPSDGTEYSVRLMAEGSGSLLWSPRDYAMAVSADVQDRAARQTVFGDATRLGIMLAAIRQAGHRSGSQIAYSLLDDDIRSESTSASGERRRRKSSASRRASGTVNRLKRAFSPVETVDERQAISCASDSVDTLFANAASMCVLFQEADEPASEDTRNCMFGGLLLGAACVAANEVTKRRRSRNRMNERPKPASPRYSGETIVFAD